MQIVNLFPTAVGMLDLGREFTEVERNYLLNQEHAPNMGNTTSKFRFILRDDSMIDLRAFVQNSIDAYFNNVIAPSKDASLYVTQSWTNYSSKGQWHHAHEHPNSILSGVFYIQTDNVDKIYFEKNQESHEISYTKNFNSSNESYFF